MVIVNDKISPTYSIITNLMYSFHPTVVDSYYKKYLEHKKNYAVIMRTSKSQNDKSTLLGGFFKYKNLDEFFRTHDIKDLNELLQEEYSKENDDKYITYAKNLFEKQTSKFSQNGKIIHNNMKKYSIGRIYKENAKLFDEIYEYNKGNIPLNENEKGQIMYDVIRILEKYNITDSHQNTMIDNKLRNIESIFTFYNLSTVDLTDNVVIINELGYIVYKNGNMDDNSKYYTFNTLTFELSETNKELIEEYLNRNRLLIPEAINYNIDNTYQLKISLKFLSSISTIMIDEVVYKMKNLIPDDSFKALGKYAIMHPEFQTMANKIININANMYTYNNPLIYAFLTTNIIHTFFEIMINENKEEEEIIEIERSKLERFSNSIHNKKKEFDIIKVNKKIYEKLHNENMIGKLLMAYNYYKILGKHSKNRERRILMSDPMELLNEFIMEMNNINTHYKSMDISDRIFIMCLYYCYILNICANRNGDNIFINAIQIMDNMGGMNKNIREKRRINAPANEDITYETLRSIFGYEENKYNPKKNLMQLMIETWVSLESQHDFTDQSFRTCGETALLNLLNYVFLDSNGNFIIPDDVPHEGKPKELRDFYQKYSNIGYMYELRRSALYDWVVLISNINGIAYVRHYDTITSGKKVHTEISPGVANVTKLFKILLGKYNNDDKDDKDDDIIQIIKVIDPIINIRKTRDVIDPYNGMILEFALDNTYDVQLHNGHAEFIPSSKTKTTHESIRADWLDQYGGLLILDIFRGDYEGFGRNEVRNIPVPITMEKLHGSFLLKILQKHEKDIFKSAEMIKYLSENNNFELLTKARTLTRTNLCQLLTNENINLQFLMSFINFVYNSDANNNKLEEQMFYVFKTIRTDDNYDASFLLRATVEFIDSYIPPNDSNVNIYNNYFMSIGDLVNESEEFVRKTCTIIENYTQNQFKRMKFAYAMGLNNQTLRNYKIELYVLDINIENIQEIFNVINNADNFMDLLNTNNMDNTLKLITEFFDKIDMYINNIDIKNTNTHLWLLCLFKYIVNINYDSVMINNLTHKDNINILALLLLPYEKIKDTKINNEIIANKKTILYFFKILDRVGKNDNFIVVLDNVFNNVGHLLSTINIYSARLANAILESVTDDAINPEKFLGRSIDVVQYVASHVDFIPVTNLLYDLAYDRNNKPAIDDIHNIATLSSFGLDLPMKMAGPEFSDFDAALAKTKFNDKIMNYIVLLYKTDPTYLLDIDIERTKKEIIDNQDLKEMIAFLGISDDINKYLILGEKCNNSSLVDIYNKYGFYAKYDPNDQATYASDYSKINEWIKCKENILDLLSNKYIPYYLQTMRLIGNVKNIQNTLREFVNKIGGSIYRPKRYNIHK